MEDDDWTADVVAFDLDEDGIADTMTADVDADGTADVVAFDLDEDSVVDTVVVDVDADGTADVVAFDLDEDGVADAVLDDLVAFDLDEDGATAEGPGVADQAAEVTDDDDLSDDSLYTPPEDITNEDVQQAQEDMEHTKLMGDYMSSQGVIDV